MLESLIEKYNTKGAKSLHISIRNSKNIQNWLIENTKDIPGVTENSKFSERFHILMNNMTSVPLCKHCNENYTNYNNNQHSFMDCCSLTCAGNYSKNKDKYKQTCLEKYGVDNYSKTKKFQEKSKNTCLEKYGVEYSFQSENNKRKTKIHNIEKYGVEHYTQTEEYQEKKKSTCLNRYGVESYSQTGEFQEKRKATTLKNYGVEHIMFLSKYTKLISEKRINTWLINYGVRNYAQSEHFKEHLQEYQEKSKDTCLEKYGVKYVSQVEEFKEKSKNTCLEKYGVESYTQTQEYQEKSKNTCLEKYGVENQMQNASIFEKMQRSSFKRKKYTLPSGKIIYLQGYEPIVLTELLKIYNEDDIITSAKEINKHIGIIYYNSHVDNKLHRYYPDFYLKSENKIIEVKSIYTFQKHEKINLLKMQACIDRSLEFEFIIL